MSIRFFSTSIVLISLIYPRVYAQNEPMVIVVTPSAIEQPRSEAITAVTVIDQISIEQSNASSVAELLRGQAGLRVSDLFGDGSSQTTVDLRGFGPTATNNTLVLLDGRPLNNSTDTAPPDLSVIDIDDIAQIEILQGSAGVLYGNQAVGGVINIIRKKVTEDKASVSLTAGSYGASRLQAAFKKSLGRTKFSASVSDRQTDNYRDNNEAENQRVSLRAEHRHAGFDSYVELQRVEDDIRTPGALLEDEVEEDRTQSFSIYENDFFATDTDMLRIGINKDLDESRSFNIDYANRITDREFIQSFRTFQESLATQDRDSKTLSAVYRIVPPTPASYSSVLVGFNTTQTDYKLVSSVGPQEMDQAIHDIYLSSQWQISSESQVDIGARYSEHSSDYMLETAFTGLQEDNFDDSVSVLSLGYSWRRNNLKVFVRADQNYRFPTVEEHTNTSSGKLGLLTQEGVSVEVGTEFQNGQSRYRATLYTIELENEIAFDFFSTNLNLDETRRDGLILEASSRWSDTISVGVGVTLLDAEITDGSFKGNQLPLVPERTVRLDAVYRFDAALLFGLELIAVDEQVFGGDFENQLSKLSSYEVFNTYIAYDYRDWEFSLRINNLFDEKYSETGNLFAEFDPVTFAPTNYEAFFPSPERNFMLSAKLSF